MPLPFSFSTQRPSASADSAQVAGAGDVDFQGNSAESQHGPSGGIPGGIMLAFAPKSAQAALFAPASIPEAHPPKLILPPVSTGPSTTVIREASLAATAGVFAPGSASLAPIVEDGRIQDLSAQIEQIRNDLFSVATNLSALSDRLERLECRPTAAAQPHAEIAALRSDFERWIAHHMEPAVEQCMQRIRERTQGVLGSASN